MYARWLFSWAQGLQDVPLRSWPGRHKYRASILLSICQDHTQANNLRSKGPLSTSPLPIRKHNPLLSQTPTLKSRDQQHDAESRFLHCGRRFLHVHVHQQTENRPHRLCPIQRKASPDRGPDKAVTGKVGTNGGTPLVVQSGPLSCTKFFNRQDSTTDIRLYFVSNNEIREVKLADVGPGSDLDAGWVVPKGKADDRFSIMTGLVSSAREVDQTSYLTSGRTTPKDSSEPPAPYVVFQAPGETEAINYARASGTGDSMRGHTGLLIGKLVPAQSR